MFFQKIFLEMTKKSSRNYAVNTKPKSTNGLKDYVFFCSCYLQFHVIQLVSFYVNNEFKIIVKNLFYYCTYRIAKFYKKTKWALDYVAQGYFLMFFAFTGYFLAILHLVLFLFDTKMDKTIIVIACVPLIIEIIFFDKLFPNAQNKYIEFEKNLLNEKNKWFKGLLVLLFLLLSLTSYILVSVYLKE